MRIRFKTFIVLFLLVSAILSACSPRPIDQGLVGTSWVLISLDGDPVAAGLGGRTVTLVFEDNSQAGGSGGCNSFGGKYATNSATNSISFTDLVSTLMACTENGVDETETAYFAALNSAEHYELTATILTISGGGHTLVFVSA
jgi:heat shock protein HslJ